MEWNDVAARLGRNRRVGEDVAAMRELDVDKLPESVEEDVVVPEWSTVRVKHCSYSVPSRIIQEQRYRGPTPPSCASAGEPCGLSLLPRARREGRR
jgi:hypothetical protein